MPRHLTKEQEALVYRTSNKAKLEAEPVEITLGDVTLPLEHLDVNRLPSRWPNFSAILRQSETREDWENVVRMLEGYENAGIKLNAGKHALVVRRLNLAGMQHLILKALQRPRATGLRMREWPLMVQILRAVHDKAAMADWDEEETANALRLAKQIVELLEDEEHCGGQVRREKVSEHDFRGKPEVIAVPTGLAAALALRREGDVEEVKTLAGRLVAALKQDDYEASHAHPRRNIYDTNHPSQTFLDASAQKFTATEADFRNTVHQVRHADTLVRDLLQVHWVSNALKTSLKVLGDDMPNAGEARQYERKASQCLDDGFVAAERLYTRDGKKLASGQFDYTKELVEKSRNLE